jgi:hypothetical protein
MREKADLADIGEIKRDPESKAARLSSPEQYHATTSGEGACLMRADIARIRRRMDLVDA